jgi:YD repeat-containing protein
VGALFVLASLQVFAQGTIRYVYDEIGRLIAVIDTGGDTATYTYDAVGNLLSIDRYASSDVSIIDFSPKTGPVATVVAISGTGFSTTPNQNTVTFNGTGATVSAATSTQLTVTVPGGATTGAIAVTVSGNSDTSDGNFTVASGGGAPTVSGFSPSVAQAGTSLTVNGTNFETTAANNRLNLNLGFVPVSTATTTVLTSTVQGSASSGKVTVLTPRGSATSSGDLFIAPSGYTASEVDATGRTTIGTGQTVTVNTTNKIGLLLFDGTAGQRVSTSFSAGNITSGTAKFFDATGKSVGTTELNSQGRFIDTFTLPEDGDLHGPRRPQWLRSPEHDGNGQRGDGSDRLLDAGQRVRDRDDHPGTERTTDVHGDRVASL